MGMREVDRKFHPLSPQKRERVSSTFAAVIPQLKRRAHAKAWSIWYRSLWLTKRPGVWVPVCIGRPSEL